MEKLTLIIVVIVLAASCSRKTIPTTTEVKDAPKEVIINYQQEGYIPGTIVDMTGLDGCNYMIKLENGKKLEPDKLEDQFKQNDLPVWIKYSIPKSAMGICMSGQMVILTAIQKR